MSQPLKVIYFWWWSQGVFWHVTHFSFKFSNLGTHQWSINKFFSPFYSLHGYLSLRNHEPICISIWGGMWRRKNGTFWTCLFNCASSCDPCPLWQLICFIMKFCPLSKTSQAMWAHHFWEPAPPHRSMISLGPAPNYHSFAAQLFLPLNLDHLVSCQAYSEGGLVV